MAVYELLDSNRILVYTWSDDLLYQAKWQTVQIIIALRAPFLHLEDFCSLVLGFCYQDSALFPQFALCLQ
jgi:hypothetical protein